MTRTDIYQQLAQSFADMDLCPGSGKTAIGDADGFAVCPDCKEEWSGISEGSEWKIEEHAPRGINQ